MKAGKQERRRHKVGNDNSCCTLAEGSEPVQVPTHRPLPPHTISSLRCPSLPPCLSLPNKKLTYSSRTYSSSLVLPKRVSSSSTLSVSKQKAHSNLNSEKRVEELSLAQGAGGGRRSLVLRLRKRTDPSGTSTARLPVLVFGSPNTPASGDRPRSTNHNTAKRTQVSRLLFFSATSLFSHLLNQLGPTLRGPRPRAWSNPPSAGTHRANQTPLLQLR